MVRFLRLLQVLQLCKSNANAKQILNAIRSKFLRHKTHAFFFLTWELKNVNYSEKDKTDNIYGENLKETQYLVVVLTWNQFWPAVHFGEQHFHS